MNINNSREAMLKVADFFDSRKVGNIGPLGFRRSSDLERLLSAIETLQGNNILCDSGLNFLDVGCGDGRVNILLSYIADKSIGIELDEWTLDDYSLLREELDTKLIELQLPLPPDNIHLFVGDSLDPGLHGRIHSRTGVGIEDIDIFYTYLTLHEEIAELISQKAKPGAVFMVYGLEKIMPRYDGLELLTPNGPLEGIIAVYKKIL
jgi:SAM-dependent methyltransferase